MHITTIYQRTEAGHERTLSPKLAELYDGDLSFPEKKDRTYVIGNFVQTIDGVVSFQIPLHSGGTEISGSSAEDRYVMGLLRSVADAVLVGSGTLHGDPGQVRISECIYPEAKGLYAAFRQALGKPPLPLNIILTASGHIDLKEPTFHTEGLKAVIITTDKGVARLAEDIGQSASPITVCSTGKKNATTPGEVLRLLANEFGVRLLLCEGGPTIFGEFLSAGMIDELFLTCAPQIAGRQKMNHGQVLRAARHFFRKLPRGSRFKASRRRRITFYCDTLPRKNTSKSSSSHCQFSLKRTVPHGAFYI